MQYKDSYVSQNPECKYLLYSKNKCEEEQTSYHNILNLKMEQEL